MLILGSFPSPKSREYGFFYGHPQNRFWKVLAAVLEKPLPRTNEEKHAFLLENGIALWDVLHACEIEGASDASIAAPEPNDLSPILSAAKIRAVFTTGGTAAKLYKRHIQPAVGREAIPLPRPARQIAPGRLNRSAKATGLSKIIWRTEDETDRQLLR